MKKYNFKIKKLYLLTILIWLLGIAIWQILFNTNSILSPIVWEIHTIFTSVLIFYILINYFIKENLLDIIKIILRILFKVWIVIFIAFSLKKSYSIKGFLLTATFVFGYLEGLIDLNSWLNNGNGNLIISKLIESNNKKNRILISIFFISVIHIFSALIAFLYFSIN